jgi:hypothetical protein
LKEKRVKRIGLEILVDESVDGDNLAEEIAEQLDGDYAVIGSSFQEDLTEIYEKSFPDMLNCK